MRSRVHEVAFHRLDDAVAFVAAVARQCAAPMAADFSEGPLLANVGMLDDQTRVYLSHGALIVAQRAFGPVPHVPMDASEVPVPLADLIRVDLASPAGVDDVMGRLTGGEERQA